MQIKSLTVNESQPNGERFAAIDLGSNSFHLIVASEADGHLQVRDRLREMVRLAGGLTELKKIAASAETYDLHIQPHNCHGPIATAAAVQLDACMPNFVIQETVPCRESVVYELVNEPLEPQIRNGRLPVPTTPGLGVTLNEEYVGRCPRIEIGQARRPGSAGRGRDSRRPR